MSDSRSSSSSRGRSGETIVGNSERGSLGRLISVTNVEDLEITGR